MKLFKFVAVGVLSLIATPLFALSVGPLAVQLDPLKGRNYSTVTAINNSDRTVAIETYAERRVIDAAGNETLVRADDDFIVFPPLRSIPAGASQAFRIQWIGDVEPSSVEKYYVTIAQLPITVEELEAERGPLPTEGTTLTLRLGYAFKVAVTVGSSS